MFLMDFPNYISIIYNTIIIYQYIIRMYICTYIYIHKSVTAKTSIYSQVYFCFASWDLPKQVKQFFIQKVLNH